MSGGKPPGTLEVCGIGKRYGRFTALDDICLDIQAGEFLTLLGPSGSGKTTLLMILAGFLPPSSGQLLMDGRDITRLAAQHREFGMVFQGYALFPHLTVAENIAFPLRLRGVRQPQRDQKVQRMLDTVGLAEHGHKYPAQLSGGQQQRVAIARALVFEPRLLLLDEPLSALDKNLREQLQSELQRIHREAGTSFVFVTHDQAEALALSTRIAVFDHGRLMQLGTPQQIHDRPGCRFVAEFIGRMNLLALSQAQRQGECYAGGFAGTELKAPALRFLTGDSLTLAVRSQAMQISRPENPPSNHNALPGKLQERVYQGTASTLLVQVRDGSTLRVDVAADHDVLQLPLGSEVQLSWPVSAGTLLDS